MRGGLMVQGRDEERDRLDRMLADARTGTSAALLIHGEAGIGKTALLEYAARSADGMRSLRVEGIESELELAFGGLHQLLLPVIDLIDQLPGPQAAAMRAIFGLADDVVGDRFTIGLAVLTMLSEAAGEGRLLCLIDDAQWLDQASMDALSFAARRLQAEGVVMIFTVRGAATLRGVPHLHLRGLADEDAAALVAGLSPYVAKRIMEESQGNPLALRELSAALTPAQRAGQLSPLTLSAPSNRVQDDFLEQIRRLPEATQAVLLVAAADDTGDLDLVLNASAGTVDDLEPAERATLIVLSGDGLRFRHPLIRYAVYQGAPLARRLAAHQALANLLTSPRHAHRRAWHLAAAARGPDEQVAGELERVAEWAGGKQAMASASAAYERSAQLTPDATTRTRRLIAAAQAATDAGQDERGGVLADQVTLPVRDPGMAADLARVRAVVELGRGSPEAAGRILVECAGLIGQSRPDKLPSLLVDALHAAYSSGKADLIADIGTRAPDLRVMSVPVRLFTGDVPGALGELALLRDDQDAGFMDRLMTGIYCQLVADHAAAHKIAAEAVAHCRAHGISGWLATALHLLAQVELARGLHEEAAAHASEGLRLADHSDLEHRAAYLRAVLAMLAAVQGRQDQCRSLAEDALAYTRPREVRRGTADALWALGLLELGLGHAEVALERLEQAREEVAHPLMALSLLPDLVEAAVRSGRPQRAKEAVGLLEEWANAVPHPALGALAHRCLALTSSQGAAEEHFAAAVRLHEGGSEFERARTELLYGEWLRRARRSIDARGHLHQALDRFARLGAEPWARRTVTELQAAGERPDPAGPADGPINRLSPQEREVVRLAATGATNREIAARLFLSPRTVGHHLYRAFPKLGVSSRAELATVLAS